MHRRHFLRAGAGAAVAGGLGLWWRHHHEHSALPRTAWAALKADVEGVVDLPPGFTYQVLERAGGAMDDGLRVPALPDGMACFRGPPGQWVLMRNHELDVGMLSHGAFPRSAALPAQMYDREGAGAVTRVVIDARRRTRLSSNLVLAGTARNCSGGPSPWGWLSCEESERPGHGHVFLCATDAARMAAPRRIDAYGRFNHEALAIHGPTLTAYLSEDRTDSCFYRMRPPDPARPFEGPLEALALPSGVAPDTAQMGPDETLPVHWVRVKNPAPAPGEIPVRHQAQEQGAALVRRGEGVWADGDAVFFTATIGGPTAGGQIFELLLDPAGDRLRVVAQSPSPRHLDMPDNLTVTPTGDLLVCEDGSGSNYLRWVSRSGEIRPFARGALSDSEFAGVCFSPDGQALFVNLQYDGLTLVVTGPFQDFARDLRA